MAGDTALGLEYAGLGNEVAELTVVVGVNCYICNIVLIGYIDAEGVAACGEVGYNGSGKVNVEGDIPNIVLGKLGAECVLGPAAIVIEVSLDADDQVVTVVLLEVVVAGHLAVVDAKLVAQVGVEEALGADAKRSDGAKLIAVRVEYEVGYVGVTQQTAVHEVELIEGTVVVGGDRVTICKVVAEILGVDEGVESEGLDDVAALVACGVGIVVAVHLDIFIVVADIDGLSIVPIAVEAKEGNGEAYAFFSNGPGAEAESNASNEGCILNVNIAVAVHINISVEGNETQSCTSNEGCVSNINLAVAVSVAEQSVCGEELDEAFNVGTGGVVGVHVILCLIGEGEGYGYFGLAAGGNDNDVGHIGGCHAILIKVIALIGVYDNGIFTCFIHVTEQSQVIDEEGGPYGVLELFGAEVMYGEGEGVNAGLFGIVADLKLRTSTTFNGDVSLGLNSLFKVHFACALVTNECVIACAVKDGGCGAHEDGVDHDLLLACAEVGEHFSNILGHDSHTACDMGGSHGGAVPSLVISAGDSGVGCGVDSAAGCGDLGLHAEGRSAAPAGEVGRHIAACCIIDAVFSGNINEILLCVHEVLSDLTGDCNMGDLAFVAVMDEVIVAIEGTEGNHIEDFAPIVVVDDTCGCACILCCVALFNEGGGATAYDRNLALNVDTNIVAGLAVTGDHNELEGLTAKGVCELSHVALVFGVAIATAVNCDIEAFCLAVLNSRNGHTMLPSGGGTNNAGVGVGCEVVTACNEAAGSNIGVAPCVAHCCVVIVTCCHCEADAGINYSLKDIAIGVIPIILSSAGRTKGEVCAVNAENHTVLKSCKDSDPTCTAAGIEYLHDSELSILCYALDLAAVTCCDTGNMGSVVAAYMVYVVVVLNVIPTEGDLCAVVNLSGVHVAALEIAKLDEHCDVIFGILDIFGLYAECLMSYLTTGIDDSDTCAFTGIAEVPSGCCTDLIGGVEQFGAFPFHTHESLNTFDLVELFDQAVFAAESKAVEQNGVVVGGNDLKTELLVDGVYHLLLSCLEFFTIAVCALNIGGNIGGRSLVELYHDVNDGVGSDLILGLSVCCGQGASVPDAGNIDTNGAFGFKSALYLDHVLGKCAAQCRNDQHECEKARKNALE